MSISKQEVEHIARLARLKITADEPIVFAEQLSAILNYMTKMNELDTSMVEPMSHSLLLRNVDRADEVQTSLSNTDVLKNAPRAKDGLFKVPQVI